MQTPGDKEMCDAFQGSLKCQTAEQGRAGILAESGRLECRASHLPVIKAVHRHSMAKADHTKKGHGAGRCALMTLATPSS